MEFTGKYWVPVFHLLEDEINVVIPNPKWAKAIKDNKDDTKDSKWIGDLFRLVLVRDSYIPCKKTRILREYTRYRYKLVSCRSSEKNSYQNALTVCNVALDAVVSDIFGKSSTSIIDYLLEQWNPSVLYKIDMPVALVEKHKASVSIYGLPLLSFTLIFPYNILLMSASFYPSLYK